MAQSAQTVRDPAAAEFSAREAAVYSRDMLLSLRRIAVRQGQERLAELLGVAATEAARLAAPGSVRARSTE
jgi:hypothetical protein